MQNERRQKTQRDRGLSQALATSSKIITHSPSPRGCVLTHGLMGTDWLSIKPEMKRQKDWEDTGFITQ